jgi:hypothetical protein
MMNNAWAGLFLLVGGLAGCGIQHLPMDPATPSAAISTRHVLVAPTPNARIKYLIERFGIRATDYYPKVLSLQVITIIPGALYEFEARTRITSMGGSVPGHFIGTYHLPTDTLKYNEGVPRFAIGMAIRGGRD